MDDLTYAKSRRVEWLLALAALLANPAVTNADDREVHFESAVRPILVEHCQKCHGAAKQSGGLRLDSAAGLAAGGENGPVVIAGDPDGSPLIRAVRRDDLEMPPEEELSAAQVAALTAWVRDGAYWPEGDVPATTDVPSRQQHWAFEPVRDPPEPAVNHTEWVRNPVDAFVLAKLESAGLSPAPEADRRTLIRRVYYTLTGLPPSFGEVAQFVNDPDPLAYEQLVDRLLDSPHYGEHWARHWLDVARYSDTKGYVYAREERFWLHASSYRDWVVRAFNDDMPYDRFLLLQIAADQVDDRSDRDLAAMGFLTLGRRFLGVERDIIDDRIDVVTRATMGLTVACARCHDHKYDPIPTADYYSLYGVFDSCREEAVRLTPVPAELNDAEAELAKREAALRDSLAAGRTEWSGLLRSRVGDYLRAQTELSKYPLKGFDQIFQKTDTLPENVRRWERYLRDTERRGDPVWTAWHAYEALPAESFAAESPRVTAELQAGSERTNPLVLERFATPPASFLEVVERYTQLLTEIDTRWQADLTAATANGGASPAAFADPAAEQLRQVLYGERSPCVIPDEPVVQIESLVDSGICEQWWKLQSELDRWRIQSLPQEEFAVILVDRPVPSQPRIFRRGNEAAPTVDVPRQFLSVLSGDQRVPFQKGSGRRELADAIISPANPLTARVMVNRVWAQHFGRGLVDTPSDFGTRAAAPSHPELLDWLATRLMAGNWKLKELQRLLLTSATFRQASDAPAEAVHLAQERDPENRLLSRMNRKRLTFEEFRDSLLAAGGDLDLTPGGRAVEMFTAPYPRRRSLYGLIDRQFFPSTLRVFDVANPDLHIPQRLATTVAQQALFVLNHPLVLERASVLAAAVGRDQPAETQVVELFHRVYQRDPTPEQLALATRFLTTTVLPEAEPPPPTAADWQYGYGAYDETAGLLAGFTPLPHFTGTAWQGGPDWPAAELGWVQLTATGGHPGNDRAHACVRRWTAPRDMTIALRSKFIHEPPQGDGVRAFIVSDRQGPLAAESLHQTTRELNVESLALAAGETLDFVVDIGNELNSDQFLWSISLTETSGVTSELLATWNSETDFPRGATPELAPLEQLAQVLVGANEFLFVD